MSKDLSLLYGVGEEENIVATETIYGKENTVEVFKRENGEVTSEYRTYKPFIYLNEDDSVIDKFYDSTDIKPLMGGNLYNRIVHDDNYGFMKWIEKNADHSYSPFLQSQWMIQTGQTQFKGMDFDDPLRLYLDIEVLTKKGHDFPNSSREEDKVIVVSMLTNRGDKGILALGEDIGLEHLSTYPTEKKLLIATIVAIRKIDPDIIVLHNFDFDLNYLQDRCQLHGVKFQIGRDGSEPRSFTTSIKFAEKSTEYTNFQVYGRHILDTYFMAKQFDVVARELESYSLKYCADYLGKSPEGRTYIDGDRLASVWRGEDPDYSKKDLLNYALDDVKETRALDLEWGRNVFAQTSMCPLPMQDVFRYGTGNKIDLMFNREYYNCGWSFPRPEEHRKFSGGYAGTGVYGLVDQPLVYADVGSMYPTIGELLGIQPKSDELEVYPRLLKLLKDYRYKYKNLMLEHKKKGNKEQEKRYDALQAALKILLNTAAFGYVGSRWAAFNDYDEAERITTTGRKITKQMIQLLKENGSTPVRWDTDGCLTTVPEKFKNIDDGEKVFVNTVESQLNVWIKNELT